MPGNWISVNTGTRLGLDIRGAVDSQRSTLDRLKRLKAIMDQQTDGTDYTQIEAQFGLQAGTGQRTYNLVAGCVAAINLPAVTTFLDYLG
jgi:hypothetical protein